MPGEDSGVWKRNYSVGANDARRSFLPPFYLNKEGNASAVLHVMARRFYATWVHPFPLLVPAPVAVAVGVAQARSVRESVAVCKSK